MHLLYTLLLALLFSLHPHNFTESHPIFVSVTTVEANAKENILEISSRLYTEDMEAVLKKLNGKTIDLINGKDRTDINNRVKDYMQQHFKLLVNGKSLKTTYLGFEKDSDAIIVYLQVNGNVNTPAFHVYNSLLYDHTSEQLGLMHFVKNGKRVSTRLNYPTTETDISF